MSSIEANPAKTATTYEADTSRSDGARTKTSRGSGALADTVSVDCNLAPQPNSALDNLDLVCPCPYSRQPNKTVAVMIDLDELSIAVGTSLCVEIGHCLGGYSPPQPSG